MAQSIEQDLLREKVARDDTSAYIGDLLVRQRWVNKKIFSFSEDFLQAGATVVDACAGPEGSLLAGALHDYRWYGNEISHRFAHNLKATGGEAASVTLADFIHSPYSTGFADAVYFIFAMNNLVRHQETIREAHRITNQKGLIVIADPGPTVWIANIFLKSLCDAEGLSMSDTLGRGRVFSEEISNFFSQKPYTAERYVDYLMVYSLGTTREDLRELFYNVLKTSKRKKDISFDFQNELLRVYFEHLVATCKHQSLELQKTGILALGQDKQGEWIVAEPVSVEQTRWIDDFINTRQWKGPLVEDLPHAIAHSAKRLVVPILCFKKSGDAYGYE